MKKRNTISGQWSSRRLEMLESPAYRALTLAAHRVISRIEIELCRHGGNDNGRLPVTFEQFMEYGLNRASVASGIRVAEALGFIRVTERGRGGNAEYRAPNKFYSTFSTWTGAVPTDEWRKIKTIEEAGRVAKAAQGAKSEVAVAFGKRSSQRRNKTNPSTGKCHVSVRETDTGNPSSPVRVTHTTGSVQKPILLSISGVGGAAPASSLSVPALEPVAASLQPDLRKIGLVWSAPTLVELEWDASWAAVYAAEFPKARSFV